MKNNEWLTLEQVNERINCMFEEIDQFTEYIDSYWQMIAAQKSNDRIKENIKKMKSVVEKFEKLQNEVYKKYPNAKLYYKKGNFKLVIGKTVKYAKL